MAYGKDYDAAEQVVKETNAEYLRIQMDWTRAKAQAEQLEKDMNRAKERWHEAQDNLKKVETRPYGSDSAKMRAGAHEIVYGGGRTSRRIPR